MQNKINCEKREIGFLGHCKVATLILNEMGANPHTKHHIRGALREASKKVTTEKGSTRNGVKFLSEKAVDQLEFGTTKGLVLEHSIPVSYINNKVLKLWEDNDKKITEDEISNIILDWTKFTIITQEEHKKLMKAKLGQKMPENWSENVDDWGARYAAVNIKIIQGSYKSLIQSIKKVRK